LNIAFPAVLLFLFLSPGFVFHRFYQPREVRAADIAPFSATVLMASTVAVLVNAAVIGVAVWWGKYEFHLGELVRMLAGGTAAGNDAALSPVYRRLDEHPFEPLLYFAATNAAALCVACLWRLAVWKYKLDHPTCRLYTFIRPPAPWHYLFRGIDVTALAPDGVVIAAIVPLKDQTFLYTGLLEDYELTEKGDLDRLILSNAARRRIGDDRSPNGTPQPLSGAADYEPECVADLPKRDNQADSLSPLNSTKRFYAIEGDYFVLRASEFITLNIKFLVLEDLT
jgi:hypothetical protein